VETGFASDRAPLIKRAHDLIAKTAYTLADHARTVYRSVVGMIMTDQI
jgi:hypothetical protein